MAGLNFIITADNSGMMQSLKETQDAMKRTAQTVEQIGELLNLDEFREASASVTDFANKVYEASRESVSNLSSMSQEFSSQAGAIRQEMESMLGGGSMDGMTDKLEAYQQAAMDASASAQTAYNIQSVAVATLAEELDTLQQAQEAALSAGDSGTAQALQGDIDALSGTLQQAQEQLSQLGVQADKANQQLNNLDATFAQFGGNAQSVGSAFDAIKGKISEATESTKNWLTGNGKFTEGINSMKEALSEMGGAFTPAIAGAKKMLLALRAMIKTPIGAVLAAIVLALQAMHKWFNKSATGQIAFAKVSAYVGSILNSIMDVAVKVGEYLYNAFASPNKPLGAFARNVGSTFVNAIKAAYHVVEGFAKSIGSLVDILKGAASFDGNAIISAWDRLKDAGNIIKQGFGEAGKAFVSAVNSQINLVKGVVSVVSDGIKSFSFSGLSKWTDEQLDKMRVAGDLAVQQKEQEIALSEAQAKQAEYEKQIGDKYAQLYKLKGKERQDAINELKELQKAKYDDIIKAQTQLYEITKKNNSLHSSTLEDLQHERDLRVQMLQTEAQQANSTRMLARLEASNERQMASAAAKSAKGGGKVATIDTKKVQEAEAALAELERKQDAERISQQIALEDKLTSARIAAMKEGAEKVAAQREQENKQELLALSEQLKAAKEAEYQRQKLRYEAEQKTLPEKERKPWEAAMLDQSEIDKIVAQYEELGELIKQKQKNIEEQEEQSAMRSYLMNYGTYQERRLAIAEEYADKISKATTEGDRLALEKQKEEALSQLDKDFGLKAQQMAELFEDASKKSVKAIETIIKKYEALVKFMKGANGETKDIVSRDDLLKLGFNEEDIRKVQTGEIKIKDITDRIKELRKETEGKSPLKAFVADIEKAVAKIKDGKLAEGLDNITQAVQDFIPSIKGLATSIASAFGGNTDDTEGILGLIETIPNLVFGIIETIEGDAVSGLEKVAQNILQLSDSIDKIEDKNDEFEQWKNLAEITESLVGIYDDLIERKKEYLSMSVGADTLRTEQEITDMLNQQIEAWRTLTLERLRAGASKKHHSIGYRIMRDAGDEALLQASEVLGGNVWDILGKTAAGLFNLTTEQLRDLKEQAPLFWSRLDGDVQNYLNNIIEGAERLKEIQDSVKEHLTQTTFDNVKDEFLSKLADMEAAASDFSDNFSQMLFQAMLKNKFNELFNDRLQDWYDNFAKSMEDNDISDSERNALLSEWDGIVSDSMKLRDNLADVTGYAKSVSEGSGLYKAVSSFSQEQGDELNGRLAAIQIGQQYANEQLTMAIASLQGLSVVASANSGTIVEMRNLMLVGNSHLEDIARYTRIAAKYGDAIEQIATKIKEL